MPYAGPIACPNCQCPISANRQVCPYCSSLAPATATWQGWGRHWEVQAIAAAAIVLCVVSDLFLGTQILSNIAAWLKSVSAE